LSDDAALEALSAEEAAALGLLRARLARETRVTKRSDLKETLERAVAAG
jgi:hypothetical protein